MVIKVLSTSDVHGYFVGDDFRRPLHNTGFGLARAATIIKQVQQESIDDLVITIENGDFIQGSPLTNYIEQKSSSDIGIYQKLAQTVGYDVRILGNHEFNYGRNYLEKVFQDDPSLLNANILDIKTQEPFIGKSYQIFEKNGQRVAVIGVTTQFIPHWESVDHIQGLVFQDPVETVRQMVANLQSKVDKIIVAYHGGFNKDLVSGQAIEPLTTENQGTDLLAIDGVAAVVTGHQHREIADVVGQKPTTQPGYRGTTVALMTLGDQPTAKLLATATAIEDPAVKDLVQPLICRVNKWLDEPVGHVGSNMRIENHFAARLYGHPFVELVNQIQMAATGAEIAASAIFNDEVRGLNDTVTVRDVMTNYIYPNTLSVVALTGQEIYAALEENARYFSLADDKIIVNPDYLYPKVLHYNYDLWSGITYTMDFSQEPGQRIAEVRLAGDLLDLQKKYQVAINNYRANGAGNSVFSYDKIIREGQTDIADLIVNYLLKHSNLHIEQPTNITVLPEQGSLSEK